MSGARKYLDRGRRIWLEGRPTEVDWMTLLGVGRTMVRGATPAPAAPRRPLEPVMWEGSGTPYLPRPVLFDFPVLREWIALEEGDAVSYLRSELGPEHAPETGVAALEAMARQSCHEDNRVHSTHPMKCGLDDDEGTWMVGVCRVCLRGVLALHAGWPPADEEYQEWDFYDQEVAF